MEVRSPLRGRIPVEVRVSNDQNDVAVDVDALGGLMSAVLEDMGVDGPGEASLLFVGRDEIAQLNKLHLHNPGPTDVLSFPIDAADVLAGVTERLVGDVVVCPAVAAAGASGHAGDTASELALLVVHGTLHLLGHDHAEPEERSRMWSAEQRLLREHWGSIPGDPWAAST